MGYDQRFTPTQGATVSSYTSSSLTLRAVLKSAADRAGMDERARGEFRMPQHSCEKLSPFRRAAGVGDVAGDQDMVERPLRVHLVELLEQLRESVVAARAEASAFEPEPEALADDMHVGKMHHAP